VETRIKSAEDANQFAKNIYFDMTGKTLRVMAFE
jgi:hypothetical protein